MHDAQFTTDFLNSLLEGRRSDEPHPLRLLQARGFLLDFDHATYRLSDNSAPGDAEFLDRWLRRHDLGSVDGACVRINVEQIPHAAGLDLFRVHDGREAFQLPHHSAWGNFRSRRHGPKVPVNLLDPFIARLVKAVCSAGVGTYGSCDGHGEPRAVLGCSGVFHATWLHVVLYQYAFRRRPPACRWRIHRTGNCRITAPDGEVPALYQELQEVAEIIYRHRQELRDAKARLVTAIRADAELETHVRAFEHIRPELSQRYRGQPPLCPELCHVFADLAAPAARTRRVPAVPKYASTA